MGGEIQSERVEETRDARGVRIFLGINPLGGRARSERERENQRAQACIRAAFPAPVQGRAGPAPRAPTTIGGPRSR